jgi:type I restriction enzyme M protein
VRILEITGDPAFAEIISAAELTWLEGRINDSNPAKPTIPCLARQKDVPAKKEEIVRQLWLHKLTTQYSYPIERITVEYPITFGRDTSKRADIVVFDEDRRNIPYIMIEVKAPKLKDGKDQLKLVKSRETLQ